MLVYLGSNCPDCPSPEELSATQVETRIRMVLDSAAIPPLGAGLEPLRRGIAGVRVSTSGPVSTAFTILSLVLGSAPHVPCVGHLLHCLLALQRCHWLW
jgi:hypothetical protein